MDGQEIRARYNAQWSLRKTIEQEWDLVSRFVYPLRGGDMYRQYTSEHAVEHSLHRREIYDSTAPDGANNLSAAIHGALTSPLAQWFGYKVNNREVMGYQRVRDWLQECAYLAWNRLQESNFNTQVNETYLDLVGYGTSPLVMEPIMTDKTGTKMKYLQYRSAPVRETYFEADHNGHAHIFYRRREWTALQVMTALGPENTPPEIRDQAEHAESSDQRHDVIYCVYPNEGVEISPFDRRDTAPENRPWIEKYVLEKTAQVLRTGGFYHKPMHVPRWRTTSGSQWGHSPAMLCMGTILTVNDLMSMKLDALERNIDPPMLVTERGLLSDRDLSPGGMTVVRNMDDLKPWESNMRLDWTKLEVDDLRGIIQRAFYVDRLELKDSPAMTATEVQVRYDLMQRLLGPTMGRLEADLLDPVVKGVFETMYRYGELPDAPPEISDQPYSVEYTGPMARAQKSQRVSVLMNWVRSIAELGPIHPALEPMLDVIDVDQVPLLAAEMGDVPEGAIRDKDEVAAVRDDRAKKQAAAEQAAAAQAAGDAMKSVGEGQQALNPPTQ